MTLVADFIATLAPTRTANWEICKREGLWGVVGQGTNWRKNADRVRAGDRIFVWRGGRHNGFIAWIQALGPLRLAGARAVRIPWPDPDWFGGVFPMRVVAELDRPESDTFPNDRGRYGVRFGFNNTALQHIFEEVSPAVAARIATAFLDAGAVPRAGVPHAPSPSPPTVVEPRETNYSDPDLAGRGLRAHHDTVEALAAWLRRQGIEPLLPAPGEPRFDLAWMVDGVLHIAEVKSVTPANEETQLRLGLGQVLRYRQQLRAAGHVVQAWLVPERAPADGTWRVAAAEADVGLCSPGHWPPVR
jgi:hypothetical protein